MEEEMKLIVATMATLKKCAIMPSRVKAIEIKWDKLFEEKVFPNIKIKLYKK